MNRTSLRLVAHQARYDLRAFQRNKQARFYTLLLPIVFLVVFVLAFGNDTIGSTQLKAATYYVPGLAAMAVISASFVNLVISVTAQRELGVLKRRRSTPVPPWVLLAGRGVTCAAISLGATAVLIFLGRAAYDATVPVAALPGIALTVVVGSAAFTALGYALSTVIRSADAAQPIVQAVMLPLYFV